MSLRSVIKLRRFLNTENGQFVLSCVFTVITTLGINSLLGCGEPACKADMYCPDVDGDGVGRDADECYMACFHTVPEGFASGNLDCDDFNADVGPNREEVCDGINNDCQDTGDVGAIDAIPFYEDADGDGFGNDEVLVQSCTQPSGFVEELGDCEDDDSDVYPGATEIVGDGKDNDCDPTTPAL